MTRPSRVYRPICAPVALLALAAAMPLAIGEAAAMGGASRAVVIAGGPSQDRAGTIARCVNEAARQFCSPQTVPPAAAGALVDLDVLSLVGTVRPLIESRPEVPLLFSSLIDMPPPVR